MLQRVWLSRKLNWPGLPWHAFGVFVFSHILRARYNARCKWPRVDRPYYVYTMCGDPSHRVTPASWLCTIAAQRAHRSSATRYLWLRWRLFILMKSPHETYGVVPRVVGSNRRQNGHFLRSRLGAPLVRQRSTSSAEATCSCEVRTCGLTRIASASSGAAARGRERSPAMGAARPSIGDVGV